MEIGGLPAVPDSVVFHEAAVKFHGVEAGWSQVPEAGTRLTPTKSGAQSLYDEPWDPSTDVKVPEHLLTIMTRVFSRISCRNT